MNTKRFISTWEKKLISGIISEKWKTIPQSEATSRSDLFTSPISWRLADISFTKKPEFLKVAKYQKYTAFFILTYFVLLCSFLEIEKTVCTVKTLAQKIHVN